MSEDFTWQPEPPYRRAFSIRVAMVLACAGIGIIAGSYYPITMVMTAFERANLPGVSSRGNLPSPTARETFTPFAEVVPSLSTDPMEAQPEVSGRVVLLNPGSAEESRSPEEQPASRPSAEPPPLDQSVMRRQHPVQGARSGDRNVLVVVRRSGPPYDIKILRGRIQNGRLIVNARDRRGITLR
jgi:hypothetical protein